MASAFKGEVLRALYWPFTLASILGITDIPALLMGGSNILPSIPAALFSGALGIMGCATIVLSGVFHDATRTNPAERALAIGVSSLEFRIWHGIAEAGFWASLPLGIVAAVLLEASQLAAVVLGFFLGLAMVGIGLCGLGMRARSIGRREVTCPPAPAAGSGHPRSAHRSGPGWIAQLRARRACTRPALPWGCCKRTFRSRTSLSARLMSGRAVL